MRGFFADNVNWSRKATNPQVSDYIEPTVYFVCQF
jgi:hypothetical protein